jgi:L-ribulose-5-phosphate 4-epimerase
MYEEEIVKDYEYHTGKVIAETFQNEPYEQNPGVLVHSHGPFCWGKDALNALHNAVVLETVAEMAYHSLMLNKQLSPIDRVLHDKHFYRKHGANAYYGQT